MDQVFESLVYAGALSSALPNHRELCRWLPLAPWPKVGTLLRGVRSNRTALTRSPSWGTTHLHAGTVMLGLAAGFHGELGFEGYVFSLF